MPQRIEVPGMGIVEFPDGMSDDQIASAIQQNMPERGAWDMLTGQTGERYQLWPERLARGLIEGAQSAVTLPGDVMSGEVQLPGSQVPETPGATGRVLEMGAMGMGVNPAIRAGSRMVPGPKRNLKPAPPPTAEQLETAATKGYEDFRASGLEVDPNFVKNLGQEIEADLVDQGIIGELAPKTYAILRKIQSPPEPSVATAANLDAIGRALRKAAGDFTNPTERLASTRALDRLDRFLAEPPKESVLAGTPSAAAEALARGKGNYAALKRSEKLTGAEEAADLRASVANSGQNIDNAIRQRLASILSKPKEARGYSEKELAKMRRVAEGGTGANTARFVGNLLGGGGGLGMGVTGGMGAAGGAFAGGPVGAAIGAAVPPAIGYGSKKLANVLTRRGLRKLDEEVRKRSPLYEQTPMVPINPASREALIRAILLSEQQ